MVIYIWKYCGVEIEWTEIVESAHDLGNKTPPKKRWLITFL